MINVSQIDSYLACLYCDLLIEKTEIGKGQRAVCPRCNNVLYYHKKNIISTLALVITALILYLPTILMPFLSITAGGLTHKINLLSSLAEITDGSSIYLAFTVFLLVILLPLIKFLGLLYIILSLQVSQFSALNVSLTRKILHLASWGMIEVYLIGVVVTLIKLSSIADIAFLSGFYAFLVLMIIDTLVSLTLPKRRIWQSINHAK